MRVNGNRLSIYVSCLVLVLATITIGFNSQSASAAQIVNRSVTLQAGTTDGGSKPGGVVKHLISFTVPGGTDIGSIQFLYCTTASGTCTTPTGLVTTSATLGNETGATGFTMVNTTNGSPYITRAAAPAGTNTALSYRLDTVTNPTATNSMFFIRVATFVSTDTTGTPVDTGTVAASTATQIELTGTMPESLIFCTGANITATAGIPDCTTATSGAISFNQLFSPTDTATATSKMAASTNATNGYSISVAGPTMTSGSNTIPAMAAAAAGTRGVSQFGLNLMANTTATSTIAVGNNITPTSNGTDLRGQPSTGYEVPDTFKFVSGAPIAASNFNTPGPTNAQIYTASYIVNVAGSQTAGTYTTTLTYVCTATF
jgi:hypothetical protein